MVEVKDEDRIVLVVDFGTTFSGVAEAYSGTSHKADEIVVIRTEDLTASIRRISVLTNIRWPSASGLTSDKVPSEIAYTKAKSTSSSAAGQGVQDTWSVLMGTPPGKKLAASTQPKPAGSGKETTINWGFDIAPQESRLRCMKLLLDHQDIPSFVSSSELHELLAASGKTATAVVADYLREVYKHAKAELAKRYGTVFIDSTHLQWILTVPAVWSDGAKNATLTAAKKAGMGPDLTLISEPEAAAVYTLQAMQPSHLETGDNILCVDAGGGPVDLITFQVVKLHPLRIEESVPGSGACCGAALLNVKFEEWMKSKLGNVLFKMICRSQPRTWNTALKHFEEYVKRNFDPDNMTDYPIALAGMPDDEEVGIEQGFLTLPGKDVAAMFQPIIAEVVGLIHGQLEELRKKGKTVASIVLVGGFGQSKCLHKVLTHHFGKTVATRLPKRVGASLNGVEILQPSNTWTAVVRGAVLRGLEGVDMVTSRMSRRHYGVAANEKFYPSIHPAHCKEWDEEEAQYKAKDRMSWYIKKGSTCAPDVPLLFPFYRTFYAGDSKYIIEKLVICDRDDAPAGYSSQPGSSTRILCRMPVNLGTVPAKLWTSGVSKTRRRFKRLDCQIGMQIESGGLRFELKVDGRMYGNVTAEFE
ncbi:uncharacterized protein LTR77_000495 [Saxophila tyrrhenica]|uniref:Actin-like ATPase domain-containing protein n=1 Tax=Saxophila tyrrhenica TaxID=1690608 RepID=A0AAV9PNP7_9PEZI|nr:hypothetical protein LTR77_000495 [Saxophila tyrrhenica]